MSEMWNICLAVARKASECRGWYDDKNDFFFCIGEENRKLIELGILGVFDILFLCFEVTLTPFMNRIFKWREVEMLSLSCVCILLMVYIQFASKVTPLVLRRTV